MDDLRIRDSRLRNRFADLRVQLQMIFDAQACDLSYNAFHQQFLDKEVKGLAIGYFRARAP
jgi:hypothetical protein